MTEKTGVCLKTTEIEQYTEGVSYINCLLVFSFWCIVFRITKHDTPKTKNQ